jgi:hypothetical protein
MLAAADAGLDVPELARRLETAALDTLASWPETQNRQAAASAISQGLELAVRWFGSQKLEGPSALEQAKADFAVAGTAGERAKALNELRAAMEAGTAQLSWKETPETELQPLDLGRGLAPLPLDFSMSDSYLGATTPDGRTIVATRDYGRALVFRFNPAENKYAQLGQEIDLGLGKYGHIEHLTITSDGDTVFIGVGGTVRAFHWDQNQNRWERTGPEITGGSGPFDTTPNGETLVRPAWNESLRIGVIQILRFDPNQGKWAGPELRFNDRINTTKISGDGQTVIAGSKSGKIKVIHFESDQGQWVQLGQDIEEGDIVSMSGGTAGPSSRSPPTAKPASSAWKQARRSGPRSARPSRLRRAAHPV